MRVAPTVQPVRSIADELVPPLLEVKSRPQYMSDRLRLARQMLGGEQFDLDFLLRQLGSDDFVNRLGALYAASRAKDSAADKSQLVGAIAALAKGPDVALGKTAIKSLGSLGESALPVLEGLAGEPIDFVRITAVESMSGLGEMALPVLERLSGEGVEDAVRIVVAGSLGRVGEKAMPALERLAKHPNPKLKIASANALGVVGEKAIPVLEVLASDPEVEVAAAAAYALGKTGDKALPVLERLAKMKDQKPEVLIPTALALGGLREKGLPTLEELARDSSENVRLIATVGLGRVGEKAMPTLDRLAQDPNGDVVKAARDVIGEINETIDDTIALSDRKTMLDYLVGLQEPALATPYDKAALERLDALAGISRELEGKFGAKYVGLVVFGITEKGYMTSSSDLDYAVIGDDSGIDKEFRELAKGMKPCHEHYVTTSGANGDNANILFRGLFFGDRARLRLMQNNVLDSTTPDEWDRIRRQIIEENVRNLDKAKRYGFSEAEMGRVAQAKTILFTPPGHQAMKEMLSAKAA